MHFAVIVEVSLRCIAIGHYPARNFCATRTDAQRRWLPDPGHGFAATIPACNITQHRFKAANLACKYVIVTTAGIAATRPIAVANRASAYPAQRLPG